MMLPILPDNWKRLAPIPLTGKQPVAQFVIDRAFAEAAFFQPRRDLSDRLVRRKAVDNWRIDGGPMTDKRPGIGTLRLTRRLDRGAAFARRLNDLPNRQIKLAREFEIAFVMRGNSLDRASAVA